MTEFASEVLETIIGLFETDEGACWNSDQIQHANKKWHELADDAKNFLNTLSSKDLESICIGEGRGEVLDNGDVITLCQYSGEWQPLPAAVESFLETIWEYA